MYTITKEFSFEASHVLKLMPEGHKCGRMHGHSYRVVIELKSEQLDEKGFVVDYGDLKVLKDYIDGRFDHQHLNDVLNMNNPTAETLAAHFFWFCVSAWGDFVSKVGVSETAKTWAWYER